MKNVLHLVKSGNKFSVIRASIAEVIPDGAVATYQDSSSFLKATSDLAAFDEKMPICFGGEVKALDDNGRVGGYAILFSTKKDPDLLGDYFTKGTDFFFDGVEGEIPYVLYHHGQDPTLKSVRLAVKAKAKVDDVGLWVETQLNRRKKYEKAILQMVKDGKLGFSTGSVPHLAARKAITDEIGEITAWPPVEVSFTPTPVEPRTVVTTLKAFCDALDDYDDRDEVLKAVLDSKGRNDLPDSAFAYVAPGGKKDAAGKTTPRRLRHFPIHDEAHVRDAISRMSGDTTLSETAMDSVRRKVRSAAKKFGVNVAQKKAFGASVLDRLTDFSDEMNVSREEVISRLAVKSLSAPATIEQILAGEVKPNLTHLKAFSEILAVDMEVLEDLASPPTNEITSTKALFADQLASDEYKKYELDCALSKVVNRVMNAALAAPLAGAKIDWEKLIDESVDEYADHLKVVIKNQGSDYLETQPDYGFYLRALPDDFSEEHFVMAKGLEIEDHVQLAVSALNSIDARVRQNHANRVKSGRVISAKNTAAFTKLLDDVQAKVKEGREFIESVMPKSSDSPDVARAIIDRNRARVRLLDLSAGE